MVESILLVDDEDLFHLVFEDACSLLDIGVSMKSVKSADKAASMFKQWFESGKHKEKPYRVTKYPENRYGLIEHQIYHKMPAQTDCDRNQPYCNQKTYKTPFQPEPQGKSGKQNSGYAYVIVIQPALPHPVILVVAGEVVEIRYEQAQESKSHAQ